MSSSAQFSSSAASGCFPIHCSQIWYLKPREQITTLPSPSPLTRWLCMQATPSKRKMRSPREKDTSKFTPTKLNFAEEGHGSPSSSQAHFEFASPRKTAPLSSPFLATERAQVAHASSPSKHARRRSLDYGAERTSSGAFDDNSVPLSPRSSSKSPVTSPSSAKSMSSILTKSAAFCGIL